jgi:hypothetical protein
MSGTILGAYNILDKWGYEMDTVLLFSSPEGADPVDFYGLRWTDDDLQSWTPSTIA